MDVIAGDQEAGIAHRKRIHHAEYAGEVLALDRLERVIENDRLQVGRHVEAAVRALHHDRADLGHRIRFDDGFFLHADGTLDEIEQRA